MKLTACCLCETLTYQKICVYHKVLTIVIEFEFRPSDRRLVDKSLRAPHFHLSTAQPAKSHEMDIKSHQLVVRNHLGLVVNGTGGLFIPVKPEGAVHQQRFH
jgi:hypothetical protein